jgi:hypothetical protein
MHDTRGKSLRHENSPSNTPQPAPRTKSQSTQIVRASACGNIDALPERSCSGMKLTQVRRCITPRPVIDA